MTGTTSDPKKPGSPTADSGRKATWSERLTRAVAQRLRRWREERGLSAQQLADRTRDLGYHVPRSVIANLENGRRETLSVAELLVLAAALDVPPALLVADVGREELVEILPDIFESSWLARGWILGAADPVRYKSQNDFRWRDARRPIVLYDIHKLLIREHQQIHVRIKRLADRAGTRSDRSDLILAASDDPPLAAAFADIAYSLDRIRAHRELIKEEGFLLPVLPAQIASELLEAMSTGRHHTEGPHRAIGGGVLGSAEMNLERPVVYDQLAATHLAKDAEGSGP